jgi:hypothetical protein
VVFSIIDELKSLLILTSWVLLHVRVYILEIRSLWLQVLIVDWLHVSLRLLLHHDRLVLLLIKSGHLLLLVLS